MSAILIETNLQPIFIPHHQFGRYLLPRVCCYPQLPIRSEFDRPLVVRRCLDPLSRTRRPAQADYNPAQPSSFCSSCGIGQCGCLRVSATHAFYSFATSIAIYQTLPRLAAGHSGILIVSCLLVAFAFHRCSICGRRSNWTRSRRSDRVRHCA